MRASIFLFAKPLALIGKTPHSGAISTTSGNNLRLFLELEHEVLALIINGSILRKVILSSLIRTVKMYIWHSLQDYMYAESRVIALFPDTALGTGTGFSSRRAA